MNVTIGQVDDPGTYLAYSIQPSQSTTTLASMGIEQVSESDETNFVILGSTTSGVPNQQIKLPLIDLPKLEGLSLDAYLGNVNFRSLISANPGQGGQIQLGVGSFAGLSGKTATIVIELFFDCVFEGRKSMPQS